MDRPILEDEVLDPLIGTMIGRYRIERKIGQGGMGAVYELLQPAIHKRMALKLLHEQFAGRSEIVQRFFDEARAVNLIGHPSIVDITDFSHLPDGRPFIMMEYLQGESLEDYLNKKGPLPEGEVLEILQQICSALTAAHSKDIVHRDLKPENIFLVRHAHQEMRVKVLDFGIAKLKDKSTLDEMSQTQTGVVLGTPTYMSPEQARGNTLAADHRTDIYSLGAMLFHMLSGSPPFSGDTFAALIFKHISEPPPNLRDSRSDAADAWTGIVAKALAKAPDDRYQSVQALLTDAKATQSPSVSALARAASKDIPEKTGSKRSPLVVVAAIAVLVTSAAWWLSRDAMDGASDSSQAGPVLVSSPAPAIAAPIPLDVALEPEALEPEALEPEALSMDSDARNHPATNETGHPPEEPQSSDHKPKVRGKGKLRVIADPWAHVYLDGRRVGQTPLHLTIAAGAHKIRLRNGATGASKHHRFSLKKGATHTVREQW